MDLEPAVSPEIRGQVLDVGSADVMVAIPAYNNESTISHVMKVTAEGLATFFADMKSVLFAPRREYTVRAQSPAKHGW